jgi:regulator of replication initiation timing
MNHFNWKPFLFLLVLVLALSGCGVSKKDYEALKSAKEDLELQMTRLTEEVNALKIRVDELIRDKAALDVRITELSMENADLKSRLTKYERAIKPKTAVKRTAVTRKKKAQ